MVAIVGPVMAGGFEVMVWQVFLGGWEYANDFWCSQTPETVFHVIFWVYNRKTIIFPENVFD